MQDFRFSFLILAPFLDPERSEPGKIVSVSTLEEAFENLQPTLYLPLPDGLAQEKGISLCFKRLKDFRPQEIVAQIPWLKGETTQKEEPPLQEGLEALLSKVALPEEREEARASGIMEFVYGNEKFRNLEAAWRGLRLFLSGGLPENVSVLLVPIGLELLAETLEDLLPRLANDPPSIILIDFAFQAVPYHFELLKQLARLAENLLCPAVVWVGPGFLHLKDWEELKRLPYLPHHLEAAPWAPWHTLKDQPIGEWITMILNRIILRHPYGQERSSGPLLFKEKEPLWGSPIWPLALILKESLNRHGWPFHLTAQEGVRLEGLELEINFPEKRLSQFLEADLYPLAASPYTGEVFFPKLKTLRGMPLAFQLLVSRMSHFLIFLRSRTAVELSSAEEITQYLQREIERLWEGTGRERPEEMRIEAQKAAEGFLVTIELRPPRTLLPLREPVIFRFLWSKSLT